MTSLYPLDPDRSSPQSFTFIEQTKKVEDTDQELAKVKTEIVTRKQKLNDELFKDDSEKSVDEKASEVDKILALATKYKKVTALAKASAKLREKETKLLALETPDSREELKNVYARLAIINNDYRRLLNLEGVHEQQVREFSKLREQREKMNDQIAVLRFRVDKLQGELTEAKKEAPANVDPEALKDVLDAIHAFASPGEQTKELRNRKKEAEKTIKGLNERLEKINVLIESLLKETGAKETSQTALEFPANTPPNVSSSTLGRYHSLLKDRERSNADIVTMQAFQGALASVSVNMLEKEMSQLPNSIKEIENAIPGVESRLAEAQEQAFQLPKFFKTEVGQQWKKSFLFLKEKGKVEDVDILTELIKKESKLESRRESIKKEQDKTFSKKYRGEESTTKEQRRKRPEELGITKEDYKALSDEAKAALSAGDRGEFNIKPQDLVFLPLYTVGENDVRLPEQPKEAGITGKIVTATAGCDAFVNIKVTRSKKGEREKKEGLLSSSDFGLEEIEVPETPETKEGALSKIELIRLASNRFLRKMRTMKAKKLS